METCHICATQISKYRCSACQAQYCSIGCYTQHKTVHDGKTSPAKSTITNSELASQSLKPTNLELVAPQFPDSLTRSSNLLSSQQLHHLLVQHPRLRAQINLIYRATLEPSQESSQEDNHSHQSRGGGDFDQRRGKGRVRGGGRVKAQQERTSALWTRDSRMRYAARQLKDLRSRDGEVGNGLKEFSKLVMKMHEDAVSAGVNILHERQPDTTLDETRNGPVG